MSNESNSSNLYIEPVMAYSFNIKSIPKLFLYAILAVFTWWVFTAIFILNSFDSSINYLKDHAFQMVLFAALLSISINLKKSKTLSLKINGYVDMLLKDQADIKLYNTISALNQNKGKYFAQDFKALKKALTLEMIKCKNSDMLNSLENDNKIIISSEIKPEIDLKTIERNIKIINKII